MFKRLKEIEERIGKMREVFKEFTGYDLVKVIGVGKNEIYFYLEGFYQEFFKDRTIEITIREIQSVRNQMFQIYEEGNYLKIEHVVNREGINYLIIFEMFKFEK
jgi:hypothetical protein